jgi:hypothetical protein
MQRLLLPLSLGLLLTASLAALGQDVEASSGTKEERIRPLNLSLPRNDAVPAVWSERIGSGDAVSSKLTAAEDDRQQVRSKSQRSGSGEGQPLPYGTGFEARQRGGAGRGMGRGR